MKAIDGRNFKVENIEHKIILTYPDADMDHYKIKDITSECIDKVKDLMLNQLSSFNKTISYNWVDEKDRHIHLTLSVDNSY